jgi:hypothetical protein
MSVICSIKDLRTVAKGIEIDVGAEIIIEGLTVWECCYTFFCRGRSGEPSEQAQENTFRDISGSGVSSEWYLEKGIASDLQKFQVTAMASITGIYMPACLVSEAHSPSRWLLLQGLLKRCRSRTWNPLKLNNS